MVSSVFASFVTDAYSYLWVIKMAESARAVQFQTIKEHDDFFRNAWKNPLKLCSYDKKLSSAEDQRPFMFRLMLEAMQQHQFESLNLHCVNLEAAKMELIAGQRWEEKAWLVQHNSQGHQEDYTPLTFYPQQ